MPFDERVHAAARRPLAYVKQVAFRLVSQANAHVVFDDARRLLSATLHFSRRLADGVRRVGVVVKCNHDSYPSMVSVQVFMNRYDTKRLRVDMARGLKTARAKPECRRLCAGAMVEGEAR